MLHLLNKFVHLSWFAFASEIWLFSQEVRIAFHTIYYDCLLKINLFKDDGRFTSASGGIMRE